LYCTYRDPRGRIRRELLTLPGMFVVDRRGDPAASASLALAWDRYNKLIIKNPLSLVISARPVPGFMGPQSFSFSSLPVLWQDTWSGLVYATFSRRFTNTVPLRDQDPPRRDLTRRPTARGKTTPPEPPQT
jgi:hypothetical protein